MLQLHTKLLSTFATNFKQKIERLEMSTPNAKENFFETLLETLGNSYYMLNSMQQIQHQFEVLTGANQDTTADFLLGDEVKYAIQGVSLNMNPSVSINFTYENNLPQQVRGNLEKFKLAILTALEFSIKYCQQGVINVKVDFDSLSDNRETFMVSFTICMQINRAYNEKPIIDFLNEHSKKRDLVSYKYKDDDDKS